MGWVPLPRSFPISWYCKLDTGIHKPNMHLELQMQQMLQLDLLLRSANLTDIVLIENGINRISKARRRLSLSLRKSRVPENSVDVDDGEKLAEYITVGSSPSPLNTPSLTPSIEVLSDIEEPGLPIALRYVFIPIGTKIRRQLAPIFGIN